MSSPFQGAINYILSLDDYSKISHDTLSAESFNLERVRGLLKSLDNPHQAFPVVHIAGTKGKGSTAVLLASALQEAGFKTGLYTSPYLSNALEQIRIGRDVIPEDEFSALVDRMKPFLVSDQEVTFFEAMTALAFLYFKDKAIDIAIIETGLGGLTDATNVVEPIISVITSISFDHSQILGDTIESITRHKAGIIKPGHPVLLGKQAFPQVPVLIKEIALQSKAEYCSVDEMVSIQPLKHNLEHQTFELEIMEKKQQNSWSGQYSLSLLGRHQIENAALAVCCLMKLSELGLKVDPYDVRQGWKKIQWPCRFEVIQQDPLIVLDGAHNVDSMVRLREAIQDYLPVYKIIFVYGASLDKDIKGMLKIIGSKVAKIIFTTSGHPRAADPMKLVELGREMNLQSDNASDVALALKKAAGSVEKDGYAIIVTGSLHVAAAARQILLENKQVDE